MADEPKEPLTQTCDSSETHDSSETPTPDPPETTVSSMCPVCQSEFVLGQALVCTVCSWNLTELCSNPDQSDVLPQTVVWAKRIWEKSQFQQREIDRAQAQAVQNQQFQQQVLDEFSKLHRERLQLQQAFLCELRQLEQQQAEQLQALKSSLVRVETKIEYIENEQNQAKKLLSDVEDELVEVQIVQEKNNIKQQEYENKIISFQSQLSKFEQANQETNFQLAQLKSQVVNDQDKLIQINEKYGLLVSQLPELKLKMTENQESLSDLFSIVKQMNLPGQISVEPGSTSKLLDDERYCRLAGFLSEGKWREADQETTRIMLQIADMQEDGYLNASAIRKIPHAELQIIDQLWVKHSGGRFGLSVQRRIYEETESNSTRFFVKIGWSEVYYTDTFESEPLYPKLDYNELKFSSLAPVGHLPSLGCGWVCKADTQTRTEREPFRNSRQNQVGRDWLGSPKYETEYYADYHTYYETVTNRTWREIGLQVRYETNTLLMNTVATKLDGCIESADAHNTDIAWQDGSDTAESQLDDEGIEGMDNHSEEVTNEEESTKTDD